MYKTACPLKQPSLVLLRALFQSCESSQLLWARCGAVRALSSLCREPSAAKQRAAGPLRECWGIHRPLQWAC